MKSTFVLSTTQHLRRLLLVAGCALALGAQAQTTITMASTTSTEQSGLFAHLLPAFKKASGIDISGRTQVHRGGLWRQAFPGHVQRLCRDRTEVRPGRRARQGCR